MNTVLIPIGKALSQFERCTIRDQLVPGRSISTIAHLVLACFALTGCASTGHQPNPVEDVMLNALLTSEEINRRNHVENGIKHGYLPSNIETVFETDLAASNRLLDQARKRGMPTSVASSLEKSVRWQHAIVENPSVATEISIEMGVRSYTPAPRCMAEKSTGVAVCLDVNNVQLECDDQDSNGQLKSCQVNVNYSLSLKYPSLLGANERSVSSKIFCNTTIKMLGVSTYTPYAHGKKQYTHELGSKKSDSKRISMDVFTDGTYPSEVNVLYANCRIRDVEVQ